MFFGVDSKNLWLGDKMIEVVELKDRTKPVGWFVNLSRESAYSLIRSLAEQLESGNPNTNRPEFTTKDGKYFSVAVHRLVDMTEPNKSEAEKLKDEINIKILKLDHIAKQEGNKVFLSQLKSQIEFLEGCNERFNL